MFNYEFYIKYVKGIIFFIFEIYFCISVKICFRDRENDFFDMFYVKFMIKCLCKRIVIVFFVLICKLIFLIYELFLWGLVVEM